MRKKAGKCRLILIHVHALNDFYTLCEMQIYELLIKKTGKVKINKHGENKWIFTSIICISFILSRLGDVRHSVQRFH